MAKNVIIYMASQRGSMSLLHKPTVITSTDTSQKQEVKSVSRKAGGSK